MKPEFKKFIYTKDSGDRSERKVVFLRVPQKNYLGLDVSDLSPDDINQLLDDIAEADEYRNAIFEAWSNRWRSFKPEGIEWLE
jgi:hypothetical protein